MLALFAVSLFMLEVPKLGIESVVLREKPPTSRAATIQNLFRSQIENRNWLEAFRSSGEYLDEMGEPSYIRMQRDWHRYELLLLADRIDLVLKHVESNLKPLGTYEGKLIQRPSEYMELASKGNQTEEFAKLPENYLYWSTSYAKALEFVELASVMKADFKRATWAVDELRIIPSLCGTGMEAVQFQFHSRKLVYEAAQKNLKTLHNYADKGFTPIQWPGTDPQQQIRHVAIYSRWSEAGLALGPNKKSSYKRLLDLISENVAVNEQRLFTRIAMDRLN